MCEGEGLEKYAIAHSVVILASFSFQNRFLTASDLTQFILKKLNSLIISRQNIQSFPKQTVINITDFYLNVQT